MRRDQDVGRYRQARLPAQLALHLGRRSSHLGRHQEQALGEPARVRLLAPQAPVLLRQASGKFLGRGARWSPHRCAQLLQVDRQPAPIGGDEVHASDQEAARCFTQSALLAGVLLQRQRLDSDEMQELAEAVLVVAVRALGDVGWVKPEWALWPRLLPFADLLHWILDDISGVPVTPLESLLAWGIGMGRDGPESGGSALSGMRELGAAAASLHESGDATRAIFIEATAIDDLEQPAGERAAAAAE